MRKNWDIFCRVIDNYGDIGVCWRLARQLAAEHGLTVRLWVDDLACLQPLCPEICPEQDEQFAAGVCLRHWGMPFPTVDVADVVIEAFACELPESYRQAMAIRQQQPVWINLEYLSAENWVEDCHALASPHPPLQKHFFFPGFSEKTGGLLRETDLLQRRDNGYATRPSSPCLEISLFCYDNAPIAFLLEAWRQSNQPMHCRVPPGKPLEAVKRYLGGDGPWTLGAIRIEPVPFMRQEEYDPFLWSCDLNFVRGEDSFVRAQWAGRPFVWQIYPQQDDAHLEKLEAFLDRYCVGLPAQANVTLRRLFHAWNCDGDLAAIWPDFLAQYPLYRAHAEKWCQQLAQECDLAANLVKFVAGKL